MYEGQLGCCVLGMLEPLNWQKQAVCVTLSGRWLQVCHSSKQWSGLLYKVFGMRLNHYFDTQQANFVWKVGALPDTLCG